MRELLHFRVFAFHQHMFGLAQPFFQFFPSTVFLDNLGEIGMRASELLVTRRITEDFRR